MRRSTANLEHHAGTATRAGAFELTTLAQVQVDTQAIRVPDVWRVGVVLDVNACVRTTAWCAGQPGVSPSDRLRHQMGG